MTAHAPGTIVATFHNGAGELVIAPAEIGSPAHTLALERAGFDFDDKNPGNGGAFEYVLLAAWGAALVRKMTTARTIEAFADELARLEVEVPDEPRPTQRPPRAQSPVSRSRSKSTPPRSSDGTATSGARSSTSSPARKTATPAAKKRKKK